MVWTYISMYDYRLLKENLQTLPIIVNASNQGYSKDILPLKYSCSNLTESKRKKKYFVHLEGFQAVFLIQAGFQSQFYP